MAKKEIKNEEKKEKQPRNRAFCIETDGSNVFITKNELAGALELKAVLSALSAFLDKQATNN